MPTNYKGSEIEVRALNAYIKLQRAAETVISNTTSHLSRFGLTTSQFAVLETLHHLGTLSQRDLASKLLKSTGNMSTVLKNLDKRGLVSRERNPDDNRYMRVSITDPGRELLLSFFEEHVQGIVEEMSILKPAEQDDLSRLCRKLGLRKP